MAKYVVKITIESDNTKEVQQIGNLIQGTLNKVDNADVISLLNKVNKNPSIVKTALNFL